MRPEQAKNNYDDGNIPEIDSPKDFDPMEVSIPAPYPLNSAGQGQVTSTMDSHTSKDQIS